jgi:hypothetical protein
MHNRWEKMVEQLRRYGIDYAFSDWQTVGVVIVGPGSPFSVTPTPYAIADVHKAAAAGLLEKRDINCRSHFSSFNRDVYVVKQP